jgi:carbonic anhydrase
MAAQQYDAIKAANAAYVAGFGAKGELPMPPARKAAVVVCMVRAAPRAHA